MTPAAFHKANCLGAKSQVLYNAVLALSIPVEGFILLT